MTDPAFQYSELYAAYAAGTLDPGYALLVETQGALREDVRRSVAVSEATAGMLLEAAEPVAMHVGALESTLALIDALDVVETGQDVPEMETDDELRQLPASLYAAIAESRQAKGWKALVPGIRRLTLDVGGAADVELYRIMPGAAVPRHTHAGNEYTLVVAGGFSDATGSFGPGDLAMKGPDDTHRPVGDAGEVCYALAVRDGGLRFKGGLGLIQRLLGQ